MSWFSKLLLWINYLILIALIFAVTAKYIPPILFWIPAFFGLAFPFIFLLTCLFTLFWIIQLRPFYLLGCLGIFIAVPTASRYIQFSNEEPINDPRIIKVTSYNCMLFDLYNWKQNKKTRPKIFATIAENDPGILCLQEFYNSENPKDYNNIDSVRKEFGYLHHYAEYTYTQYQRDHWGMAIFSKYPIVNRGRINFNTSSNNICIFTDLLIGGDTIRVYNIHLQSISFTDSDNKFLEEVTNENKDAQQELEHSKNILKRIKRAFVKRTKQVENVCAHMNKCRYKIILCGDFNDTAASYAYESLSEDLEDCFLEKGNGFGRTYAGKWPQFRIDYILHSPELTCKRYRRSTETYTDHYPITAFFEQ